MFAHTGKNMRDRFWRTVVHSIRIDFIFHSSSSAAFLFYGVPLHPLNCCIVSHTNLDRHLKSVTPAHLQRIYRSPERMIPAGCDLSIFIYSDDPRVDLLLPMMMALLLSWHDPIFVCVVVTAMNFSELILCAHPIHNFQIGSVHAFGSEFTSAGPFVMRFGFAL